MAFADAINQGNPRLDCRMKTLDNPSLLAYNTFGIDVAAKRMVMIEEAAELQQLTAWGECMVVGCGSDIVFTHDYAGTVVRLAEKVTAPVCIDGRGLTVWAGMILDELVQWVLANGYYGIENLSGIPGTVGAGVVQNVGAYGVELGDVVEEVEVYDRIEQQFRWLEKAECDFCYRGSMIKQAHGRYVVVRVRLKLSRTFTPCLRYQTVATLPHASAEQLREAILALRWSKLPKPEEYGSAGSFFKNPIVAADKYHALKAQHPDMPDGHPTRMKGETDSQNYKISAAWLIDRAGWKGKQIGNVGVWPHQALVLYNTGHCTGMEVVAMAEAIQNDVLAKYGVRLEPEAIII